MVWTVEYIARMMVRYRAFEEVYLRGSQSEMERTLGDCLVRLYAEILTHLSYAVMFFEENTFSKLPDTRIRQIHPAGSPPMACSNVLSHWYLTLTGILSLF